MKPRYYTLNLDHSVSPCDMMTWGRAFEGDRTVARDEVEGLHPVTVSTVFLGLDHSFMPDDPPATFETMIFGGPHDDYQTRYSTWDEAVAGHAVALALAKGEASE